ncbi:hypothetical protein K438DRAFT_1767671 [Mycena galopus ATCC 62051]|nr:hypothetical protein K438DRAFT_1767671 [Mycena galopus ATCC 62051]
MIQGKNDEKMKEDVRFQLTSERRGYNTWCIYHGSNRSVGFGRTTAAMVPTTTFLGILAYPLATHTLTANNPVFRTGGRREMGQSTHLQAWLGSSSAGRIHPILRPRQNRHARVGLLGAFADGFLWNTCGHVRRNTGRYSGTISESKRSFEGLEIDEVPQLSWPKCDELLCGCEWARKVWWRPGQCWDKSEKSGTFQWSLIYGKEAYNSAVSMSQRRFLGRKSICGWSDPTPVRNPGRYLPFTAYNKAENPIHLASRRPYSNYSTKEVPDRIAKAFGGTNIDRRGQDGDLEPNLDNMYKETRLSENRPIFQGGGALAMRPSLGSISIALNFTARLHCRIDGHRRKRETTSRCSVALADFWKAVSTVDEFDEHLIIWSGSIGRVTAARKPDGGDYARRARGVATGLYPRANPNPADESGTLVEHQRQGQKDATKVHLSILHLFLPSIDEPSHQQRETEKQTSMTRKREGRFTRRRGPKNSERSDHRERWWKSEKFPIQGREEGKAYKSKMKRNGEMKERLANVQGFTEGGADSNGTKVEDEDEDEARAREAHSAAIAGIYMQRRPKKQQAEWMEINARRGVSHRSVAEPDGRQARSFRDVGKSFPGNSKEKRRRRKILIDYRAVV